jgi:hypothetical protein
MKIPMELMKFLDMAKCKECADDHRVQYSKIKCLYFITTPLPHHKIFSESVRPA